VAEDAKHLPFAEAQPGATGLELLLGAALKWGEADEVGLAATLAAVTSRPAALLAGLSAGRSPASEAAPGGLAVGAPADVCVFQPDTRWVVDAAAFRSRSRHTPFVGQEMPGRVRWTLVAGRVAYDADAGPPRADRGTAR